MKEIKDYVQSERLSALKNARNKALKGTSVALVVLSIITGLAFSGPAEITQEQTQTAVNKPAVIMDIGDYGNTTVEDDDDEVTEEKKGFSAIIQRFKQAVLSLPKPVKLLVIVPLWAIGTAITTAISVFWNFLFASPIGGFIMSTFIGFAVLLGLFVVTAKIFFPDIPLKKLLSKKNLSLLAVASVILAVADAVAPLFWNQYPFVAGAVKLGSGILIVSILILKVKALFTREESYA